jgi:EamA domain-containing membrane protein RarD
MELLIQYLPFIIPLIAAQLILAVVAVVHIVKHPCYRCGSKPLWIAVACLVQFIGPALYFTFGRERE